MVLPSLKLLFALATQSSPAILSILFITPHHFAPFTPWPLVLSITLSSNPRLLVIIHRTRDRGCRGRIRQSTGSTSRPAGIRSVGHTVRSQAYFAAALNRRSLRTIAHASLPPPAPESLHQDSWDPPAFALQSSQRIALCPICRLASFRRSSSSRRYSTKGACRPWRYRMLPISLPETD